MGQFYGGMVWGHHGLTCTDVVAVYECASMQENLTPDASYWMTALICFATDNDKMADNSLIYMFVFIGIGVVAFVSMFGQQYAFSVMGSRLTAQLRHLAFENLMRQEVGFFDMKENSTGRLTARLAGDAALVQATTGEKLGLAVQNQVSLIAALIIAFVSSWQLTLVLLAILPLLIISGVFQMKMLQGFSASGQAAYQEVCAQACQSRYLCV